MSVQSGRVGVCECEWAKIRRAVWVSEKKPSWERHDGRFESRRVGKREAVTYCNAYVRIFLTIKISFFTEKSEQNP